MTTEFAFVKVDVAGHSKLSRENPSSIVSGVLDAFEAHVEAVAANKDGRIWNWAGDGGLIALYRGSITDKVGVAVSVALTLLESIPSFNAEHPLPEGSIAIRIAVHCGNAEYRQNTGRIHSAAINLVAHLEHERTHTNSVSITYDVYRELTIPERERFISAGMFEGTAIYTTDRDRGAQFPKRGSQWRRFADNLQMLTAELERYKENAILVGFYRTSAALAGMLAPNLSVKPVVILGRSDLDAPLNRYASICEDLGKQHQNIVLVTLVIESAESLLTKIDFLATCGASPAVVAAMFGNKNAVDRIRRRGFAVVVAEQCPIGNDIYDELPWVLGSEYDHW